MGLDRLFEQAIREIKLQQVDYAVAGGLVASIYREEYRNTNDVDIIIDTDKDALGIALKIVKSLGLDASVVRKADLCGGPIFAVKRKNTDPCIVVGRSKEKPKSAGVDILLPSLLWIPEAARRAKYNLVDFGFGAIPTITVEDMIMAKFISLNNSSDRAKDIDDIKSIIRAQKELDLKYIVGQMLNLQVEVPLSVKSVMPDVLLRISKDVVKQRRKQLNKIK